MEIFEDDAYEKMEEVEFWDQITTHKLLSKKHTGKVLELNEGYARIKFIPERFMIADEQNLIHGGFIFSTADYAAMIAVNEPHVILSSARVNFIAPVELNDEIIFEAIVKHKESKKKMVKVIGRSRDIKVFEGEFATIILDKHVLELKLSN